MKEDTIWFFATLTFLVIGFISGVGTTKKVYQNRAIKAQVAEWQVDPQTGKKSFVYLTPVTPEKE